MTFDLVGLDDSIARLRHRLPPHQVLVRVGASVADAGAVAVEGMRAWVVVVDPAVEIMVASARRT